MVPTPPLPLKNPNYFAYHLFFLVLVSTTTLCAAVSIRSYSSVCPSVTPAPDRHTDWDVAQSLTRPFQIYDSYYFSGGGADTLFSPDDEPHDGYRPFSLFVDSVSRTSDPALVHLAATVTLSGPRSIKYLSHGRRRNHTFTQSISFVLDGYYSSASLQLCMVGTGSEPATNRSSLKHYADVALRLHVPSPSSLADPFVTGTLEGSSDFGVIQLLGYPDGDDYKYGERAPCSSPVRPAAMGSLRALLAGDFSCEGLQQQLINSYRLLDHHGSGAPTKLRGMHISRMRCTPDGAVRAYMVFSNNTWSGRRGYRQYGQLMVEEEAAVAEGHWDSARNMLCLRACRVVRVRSDGMSTLAVRECGGIGMIFWFPAVWTMMERSEVAGVLWNSGIDADADVGPISGVVSAFSFDDQRWNLSDVKYSYNNTMLEVARKHYLLKIDKEKKIIKESFPSPDDHPDFSLRFYIKNAGSGEACPVSIGSVMIGEDGLADISISARPAVVDGLLSISYDIQHNAPPPEKNVSRSNSSLEEGRISADGVYDPKSGILSMAGCQERNDSMDCQILITVQFAPKGDMAQGVGSKGAISSLRNRTTDRLFFEKMDLTLYELYPIIRSEAISRMDLESVMLVASTTLSCVFAVLQILHVKRHPETAPAMSITMLAVLALGQLAPLVLGFEVLFLSRRSRYSLQYSTEDGWLELSQAMMRVPALIAFLLHLRLLQLALFARLRSTGDQSEATATTSTSVSERIVLQVCLPLYLLGGVLAAIVHVTMNARAAATGAASGELATLRDDLASYAGLILDGFLLPQVVLNVCVSGSGSTVGAAVSPWFYMGGTVIRAAPHVYDLVRRRMYAELGAQVYASPRGDLFGVAWDILVPCGAALLAYLLFLQQRLGDASLLPSQRRKSRGSEMVSHK